MGGRGREASPGAQNPSLFRIKTEQVKKPSFRRNFVLEETKLTKFQTQES